MSMAAYKNGQREYSFYINIIFWLELKIVNFVSLFSD
jgi:hypothetical protein